MIRLITVVFTQFIFVLKFIAEVILVILASVVISKLFRLDKFDR